MNSHRLNYETDKKYPVSMTSAFKQVLLKHNSFTCHKTVDETYTENNYSKEQNA
jgi:hypothetical protein